MSDAAARVRALAIWSGEIDIEPIAGGLSNESFKVTDGARAYVVRFGRDLPCHHVLRERETMTARAAARAGLAPALVHAGPGVLVLDYIEGRTYRAEDVAGDIPRIADLIRRYHLTMPREVSGPGFMFWPFHVIRDYAHTLKAANSRKAGELPGYLELAEELERAQMPLPIVFGHNDLLPANFLHDGSRMWLIDWDYAGWGSPLFDLGGLAANAGLDRAQEEWVLATYFGGPPGADLWRRYAAMKAAAALREAMWSMVQEIHSDLDFDYAAYTADYLDTYRAALAAFEASP